MCRDRTRTVIEQFLKFTEDQNFDGHREILAEDCVFTYPYAAENAPSEIAGREKIVEQALIGGWQTRQSMKVLEMNYAALEDPEWALIQWRNTSVTNDDRPYDQTFVNVIRVVDGKIIEFIEYYDPLVELAAGNPRARTTGSEQPREGVTSSQGQRA
ncbi:nuclear transport factor 2 family protein [Aestuariibius sp. 2305UL40-4]|uniref:nuclear transport factor 2 family protein n=1 Tax=Aestuariibius violaceus TaxID=3234132 RepID=UPI00345E2C00